MYFQRKCSECQKELNIYSRSDIDTCGPTCRKRRERRQAKACRAFPLAMYELGKIRDSIKRRERVADFTNELLRLKAEINDLLLLAGEKDIMARYEMMNGLARKQLSDP